MLAKFWNKISHAGVDNRLDQSSSRYVILTNRFAFISGLIVLSVFLLYIWGYGSLGGIITHVLLLAGSLFFFSIIILNHYGHSRFAKWMICWLSVVFVMVVSISDKILYPEIISIQDFFSYRFFLFALAIIPMLIFGTRKPFILIINLLPSFIAVVFFDYIHRPFGVNFNQFGYNDPFFYALDIIIALSYLSVVGFILNQIHATEKFESILYEQQNILEEKNKELHHMNSFINEQNHEMNAQSDNLKESHDALVEASLIIEKQKQLLINQNQNLEKQVQEKTKDLSRVTEELIINNNEMRQFSHTLSHNLKSPVATVQGLINLLDHNDLNESNTELMKYLNESVNKMHDVFSDMNEMLELRNTLYLSTEEVDLQKEIDELHNRFYSEIQRNNISFKYDLNGHMKIKTNGKRLNGILYQLISNSIKFRSERRQPEINIEVHEKNGYYSLIVRDNGLGIDLEKYGTKLFYPYQRFHIQIFGKGLGLYLVKLQTESLGGKVSVRSKTDSFTEVEVLLKA